MRRFIIVALCLSCIIFSGCGGDKNVIQPRGLTKDQQEIVDLLSSSKQEILLFSYNTSESYKSFDFWVEIYKDGELIEQRAAGITGYYDEEMPLSGELAITISQPPDFQWTFALDQDGASISSVGEPSPHYLEAASAFGPISSPQAIEDGKEIMLYVSVFSNGDIRGYDPEEYTKRPELLADYPYAHVIKCRFSNEVP